MIYNFQAMRAIAALLVTFVHIELLVVPLGLTKRQLMFGNVGVDLFFVLSGFVIVHSTLRSRPGPLAFLENRVIRVVPLYWVLTLGVFTLALAAPFLFNSTDPTAGNLVKSLLFIPYMKANGFVHPILFVGWTLNYEMFFYLAFAIALWFCRRDPRRAVYLSSAALVAFVVFVELSAPHDVVLRFFGYSIILEFVMGMWIALAANRWPEARSRLAWPLLAICSVWLLAHMIFLADAPRWLVAGVPSAGILLAGLSLERSGYALSGRRIQLLGAASYALYLSHPFVLQAIGKVVQPFTGPAIAAVASILAIIAAQLVGIALHLWLERPMVSWLKARRRSRQPVATESGPEPAR